MRVIYGFVCRAEKTKRSEKGAFSKGKYTLYHDTHLVKAATRNGEVVGALNCFGIYFPVEYIGKRVRLRVERVEESD